MYVAGGNVKGSYTGSVARALFMAEQVIKVELVHFEPRFEDRSLATGGVFVFGDGRSGQARASLFIGEAEPDFVGRVTANAHEKSLRLACMHSKQGHWLSWQSRDLNSSPKKYGGAVMVGADEGIGSFSGFPELRDEACMLVWRRLVYKSPMEELVELGRISGSADHFLELAQHFGHRL